MALEGDEMFVAAICRVSIGAIGGHEDKKMSLEVDDRTAQVRLEKELRWSSDFQCRVTSFRKGKQAANGDLEDQT